MYEHLSPPSALEIITATPDAAPYEALPEPEAEPTVTTHHLRVIKTDSSNIRLATMDEPVKVYSNNGRPWFYADTYMGGLDAALLGLPIPADYEVVTVEVSVRVLERRTLPVPKAEPAASDLAVATSNPVVI